MPRGNDLKALTSVLAVLRRPGSEVQLTQALAAFASTDPSFASGLAQIFVVGAPPERRAALGPFPPTLLCDAELVFESGRRVDLRFEDEDGRFGLLVELKIDAGYGHEQLDDYIRAADTLGYERVGLAAVTKSPPWFGEEDVSKDVRWLGSTRWSRIYQSMAQLRHAQVNDAWTAFLSVVKDQGDFGVVALDRYAVRGWARFREGSNILKALMEELAGPALDVIANEAGAAAAGLGDSELVATIKKGLSPVYTWNDRVHLRFALPAHAAEERLRIQFFASGGKVHFCVEARYPDARTLLTGPTQDERLCRITAVLEQLSSPFQQGHDWESYWTRWHSMESLIDRGDNPIEQLLVWVQEDVRDLTQAGLFASLQEISEREPRPPSPAHEETAIDLERAD